MLELLDSFQTLYGDNKHASLAASTGAEADKMIDRVDNETKEARLFLSQSNSKGSEENNTSQIGRTWQRWSRGRCKQTARADSNRKVFGRQERISVWAAFFSGVDQINLSTQFKMLRFESCLEGEVAETVKGLRQG